MELVEYYHGFGGVAGIMSVKCHLLSIDLAVAVEIQS